MCIRDRYLSGIEGVELIAVNTDQQSLKSINATEKIQIGKSLTRGGGSGSDPAIGEKAAEEDREIIESKLTGTDLLFITAGLGGGTGSGASPVIADIARNKDILTIGVLITPFDDELDEKKIAIVENSFDRIKDKVNAIVVIPNQKIYEVFDMNFTMDDAYREINEIIIKQIKGIINMIVKVGRQNIDFQDVKTTLKESGNTFIGVSRGSGVDRAKKAFEEALKNPFIGDVDLKGAKHILINFTGQITLGDRKEIENIKKLTGKNASVKFGIVSDPSMGDQIEVTILIAGIKRKEEVKSNSTIEESEKIDTMMIICLLYTSPSPRDLSTSRMPSSA